MMGLAGRPGHRGRPDVLDRDDQAAQSLVEQRADCGEPVDPGRVVILDDDVVPPRRALPDQGDGMLLRGAMEALRDFLRVLTANSTS